MIYFNKLCFVKFIVFSFNIEKIIISVQSDSEGISEESEYSCSSWKRTDEAEGTSFGLREPLSYHLKEELKKPLEMCLFNQRNGKVIFQKKFALFEFYGSWLDLSRFLNNTESGRIVTLHAEGKSILGLRNVTKILVELGSLFVNHLDNNSIWTFAFVHRGKILFEKYINKKNMKSELLASSDIVLRLSDLLLTFDGQNSKEKRRWTFCQKYGAMGDLCEEESPSNIIYFPDNNQITNQIVNIPVIIMVGCRTNYLYYSLKSYIRATDAPVDKFYFVLGSNCTQTVELLNLFGFKYEFALPHLYEEKDFFQFLFYREAYKVALKHRKAYEYVIFLEEDIEVALDFFLYIKETISLLKVDPSLYCVTGFSQTGLKNLAYDETSVNRADVQIGWGYAATLKFVEDTFRQWPTSDISRTLPYDGWIHDFVVNGKECIQPEVSRSRHFGIGMSTKYLVSEKIYLTMPLAKSPSVNYKDVKDLILPRWKRILRNRIINAKLIKNNVCDTQFLKNIQSGSYSMFYNYTKKSSRETFVNFSALGNCFKTWVYSMLGQHDHVNIIKIAPKTTFYLIAHPQSSYSDLCPEGHIPFDIRNLSSKDYSVYYEMNRYVQDLKYMQSEDNFRKPIIDSLFT